MPKVDILSPWICKPTGYLSGAEMYTARWRPFSVDSALGAGGVLNDVELAPGLATKLIEFMVLHFEITTPLAAAASQSVVGTFQDDGGVAVEPALTVHRIYYWDTGPPFFSASELAMMVNSHAVWGQTTTLAAALDVDYAPGTGGAALSGTELHISGIYRYIDE